MRPVQGRMEDTVRDRTRLQALALDQMEQGEAKLASLNRVRVGPWRWEPDDNNMLHLACDSAPVNMVKLLGMEKVEQMLNEDRT